MAKLREIGKVLQALHGEPQKLVSVTTKCDCSNCHGTDVPLQAFLWPGNRFGLVLECTPTLVIEMKGAAVVRRAIWRR